MVPRDVQMWNNSLSSGKQILPLPPLHPPHTATTSPGPCDFLGLPYPSSSGLAFCSRAPYDWCVQPEAALPRAPKDSFPTTAPRRAAHQPGTSEEVPLPSTITHATPTWSPPDPSRRRQTPRAAWNLGRQMPSCVWHQPQDLGPCFRLVYTHMHADSVPTPHHTHTHTHRAHKDWNKPVFQNMAKFPQVYG